MALLSPKTKRNLIRIFPFGIIWLIFGLFFLWTEYAIIAVLGFKQLPEAGVMLTPKILLFASTSIFLIGCFIGFLEVVYINRFFIKSSFPKKIISKFCIYTCFMFVVIFIFFQLAVSIELNISVFNPIVFKRYEIFFFSITNISTSSQLVFTLLISLLYAEISENIGFGILLNFFTGKYHHPKIENRIFLFTDMKDSTSIAEQLGHLKYFEFLRSYYNQLTEAIVNNNGEVYQYIGDEIVISWKTNKPNAYQNSILCFYYMQKELLKKKEWFLKTYGIFPHFKGAIHSGEVTVGEIGALKKEIFFTGDVLNTTARIQSLCSSLNINFLASEHIFRELYKNIEFEFNYLQNIKLKGKNNAVKIYEIKKITNIS